MVIEEEHVLTDLHCRFILALEKATDRFEFYALEHLRMSGVYWGLSALDLMGRIDLLDRSTVLDFVLQCYHEDVGGFGGNIGHDPHLLYTLSAVQVLALLDEMHRIKVDNVIECKIRIDCFNSERCLDVISLQQEDGSFIGDKWGEKDTRFSYCAISLAALLGKLDRINVDKAVEFILSCRNFDGGFGCIPDAETHSGQIFCCVGALAIVKRLDLIDKDLLGWWLAERQLPCGGLNGRPEKLEDVCYSWWVLSSLSAIERLEWIDSAKLAEFIVQCQDPEQGGISDRPDNVADVYHTFFGLAGLSLLGAPGLKQINPEFALPQHVITRLGLK